MREEAKEAKEHEGVAAFFDLDGTLMAARPSIERRFFWELRYRGEIGLKNYFRWMWEAVRLAPRGIGRMLQENKMYLKGVPVGTVEEARGRAVPRFFDGAIECVAWHAAQGHAIVLVSGTLEALASMAARELETELKKRGVAIEVAVCATRLEVANGKWTGRVVGGAMCGEKKGRAVREMVLKAGWDLRRCHAYGDSVMDRWMLAAVGKPAAVNGDAELTRIAAMHGWPMLVWEEEKRFTQSSLRTQRTRRREKNIEARSGSVG